jgi:hypothetical protein
VLTLSEDGAVRITWAWEPHTFPAASFFAPELSFGAAVSLEFTPEPEEVWRYPIITVSKCPDGFEEIEQGVSVTPRWPVSLGAAGAMISAVSGLGTDHIAS